MKVPVDLLLRVQRRDFSACLRIAAMVGIEAPDKLEFLVFSPEFRASMLDKISSRRSPDGLTLNLDHCARISAAIKAKWQQDEEYAKNTRLRMPIESHAFRKLRPPGKSKEKQQ